MIRNHRINQPSSQIKTASVFSWLGAQLVLRCKENPRIQAQFNQQRWRTNLQFMMFTWMKNMTIKILRCKLISPKLRQRKKRSPSPTKATSTVATTNHYDVLFDDDEDPSRKELQLFWTRRKQRPSPNLPDTTYLSPRKAKRRTMS